MERSACTLFSQEALDGRQSGRYEPGWTTIFFGGTKDAIRPRLLPTAVGTSQVELHTRK